MRELTAAPRAALNDTNRLSQSWGWGRLHSRPINSRPCQFDIDRLIRRTLVYGLLTALLAAVYAGLVLGLEEVFGGIGGQPPSWAVAGATLAVAALFQPARRRIQQAVDRRFHRRRYDTTKTIEAFSARLRHHVDLDTLTSELLAVIHQTMEPTKASLWLRRTTE